MIVYSNYNMQTTEKLIDEIIGFKYDSPYDQSRSLTIAEEIIKEITLKNNHHYITNFFDSHTYERLNKKQILSKIAGILLRENDYSKTFRFLESIIQLKPIKRNGKSHDVRCEYGKGDHCDCSCAGEFHGSNGL